MGELLKEGTIVRFLDDYRHREYPEFYPAPGALGKILMNDGLNYRVQWEKGSTSHLDKWWTEPSTIEEADPIKKRQSEFCPGDIVRVINDCENYCEAKYYPKNGTIGVVLSIHNCGINVKWETGSTSQDDIWLAGEENIEKVKFGRDAR